MKQKPNLHPISFFPIIQNIIEDNLENAKDLYANLNEAKSRHLFLEEELSRAIDLYTRELDIAYAFEEQIKKWKKETDKSDLMYSKVIQLEKDQKEYVQLSKNIIELAVN